VLLRICFLWVLTGVASSVQAINVVVSISPIAGILQPLLGEQDQVSVLLKPGQSPHNVQLKPSDAQKLESADLVVLLGNSVDAWAMNVVKAIPNKPVIYWMNIDGLVVLEPRKGGIWQHDHQHKMHEHALHGHSHDDNENDHSTDSESKHKQNLNADPHLWLSPQNALALIDAFVSKMKIMDVEKSDIDEIAGRANHWKQQILLTDSRIYNYLLTYQQTPFLVLHDAYQYFEKYYHLNGVGAIAINPQLTPSIKRINAIRKRILDNDVKCVFKEPQFPAKKVDTVISGLKVNIGELDPLGNANLKSNDDIMLYNELLEQLSKQFVSCFHR
jgi:zinc transport system substrate-binding protein